MQPFSFQQAHFLACNLLSFSLINQDSLPYNRAGTMHIIVAERSSRRIDLIGEENILTACIAMSSPVVMLKITLRCQMFYLSSEDNSRRWLLHFLVPVMRSV